MKQDLFIKNGITLPEHEIEIIYSRAGGPGGQHVNKANTRVTIRWNLKRTTALDENQKNRVEHALHGQLTNEGDLIIHHGSSRSQAQNKKIALDILAQKLRKALYIPKKRKAAKIPKGVIEARLAAKSKRGMLKKLRQKKIQDE